VASLVYACDVTSQFMWISLHHSLSCGLLSHDADICPHSDKHSGCYFISELHKSQVTLSIGQHLYN